MLNDMQADVLQFHKFFGLYYNTCPIAIPPERVALRRSLIAEENSELWQAIARFDMVETADGLCDLLYVTLGTRVEFGFPGPGDIAIHPKAPIAFPTAAEIKEYKIVFIKRVQLLSQAMAGPSLSLSDINATTANVSRAVAGLAAAFGIPFKACWHEVHKSNMTKADKSRHEECPLSVAGPLPGARCTCGAVLYREDGKLLKGKFFQPPDIAGILKAANYSRPEVLGDTSGTMFR